MNPNIQSGFFVGTGAALNIPLGFIPDVVFTWKVTDRDAVNIWHRSRHMAFTSGGTYEVKPGDIIQGATNTNVRARVKQVLVTTGTWAGGNAAGHIIFDVLDETGTFGSENIDVLAQSGGMESIKNGFTAVLEANVATVTAQSELANFVITTATAGVTPANGILPYVGSAAGNAQGFTVTATLSEAAHVFGYLAFRNGSQLG